jgi:hypothetical protein
MDELTTNSSLDAPATEPRVQIQLPECDRVNLLLRVPVIARRKGRIEQRIVRRYLELMQEHNVPAVEYQVVAERELMTPNS